MILDALQFRATTINPVHPRDPALLALLNLGQDTAAGISVTEDTAMAFSAVYAAVRCISETLGLLPLHVLHGSALRLRLLGQVATKLPWNR